MKKLPDREAKHFRTLMEYCSSEPNLELEVLRIAEDLGKFTADDLHVLDPTLDELNLDRRVYGSILRQLKAKGRIQFVGYVPSERETCHNRPVSEWEIIPQKKT